MTDRSREVMVRLGAPGRARLRMDYSIGGLGSALSGALAHRLSTAGRLCTGWELIAKLVPAHTRRELARRGCSSHRRGGWAWNFTTGQQRVASGLGLAGRRGSPDLCARG